MSETAAKQRGPRLRLLPAGRSSDSGRNRNPSCGSRVVTCSSLSSWPSRPAAVQSGTSPAATRTSASSSSCRSAGPATRSRTPARPGRSARTSTTPSAPTSSRASTSRRSPTSSAARSPTRTRIPAHRLTPGMTPNLLHGHAAKDVAVYVALCAGVPKCVVKNENIPTEQHRHGRRRTSVRPGRRRGLEIDDDVRHGEVEALAGAVDDVPLEPVRAALRVGRDDELVGREGAERVLDRLQRIAVADLAARVESRRPASPRARPRAARPRQRGRRPRRRPSASAACSAPA